jgi:PKD repeat protein
MVQLSSADESDWEVTLIFNETDGSSDYCILGEATDANDGPPSDIYDEPKPPAAFPPTIYTWFDDNLNAPYDILLKDYRNFSSSNYKQWNLSVQWMSYSGSTELNISWNPSGFDNNRFDLVILYDIDNDIEVNMLDNSYYEFNCPAWTLNNFNIICTNSNTQPEIPNKPNGETDGYHNNKYDYSTSTIDNDGDDVFYLFDWGDGTDSGWIGSYYSGEICDISHIWHIPGTFNITTKSKDIFGSESNWSQALTVLMDNRPPYIPNTPFPENNSIDIDVNTYLNWNGSDPDDDITTYDIYLDTKFPPNKIISKKAGSSFTISLLSKTKYYWKIVTWDIYDEYSTGPYWSFTTGGSSNGGSGNDNDQPPEYQNIPPKAIASASESISSIGSLIIFNGSASFDQDGFINNWSWNLGDGTHKNGEIVSHSYSKDGTYNVTLTVTDNQDATDFKTITLFIGVANIPPSNPIIKGPTIGDKNVEYSYSFSSIDLDGDNLLYTIYWDDNNISNSEYLANGSIFIINHSWSLSGIYTISASCSDNKTTSANSELIVLINSKFISDIGYLIDQDSDGIYDIFQNLTYEINSSLKYLDSEYLIDINNNGKWDYIYNNETESIVDYGGERFIDIPWTIIFLILIASSIIVLIVYFYKKGSF